MGSVYRIFMVQVHESSKQPPVILLSNSTAILGNEADLRCHVTSHSVTYIRWYFKTPAAKLNSSNSGTREDLIEISSILPINIFSYYQESKLNSQPYRLEAVVRVHNVSFADQGEYICEAFNEHGKARHVAFLKVIEGSNPSADGFEAKYGALSGQSQKLPLAMLIVVPAAFLVVLTAVFVRALEKTKQKHPVGLKADKSENEEGDKETAISGPQWISKFTKHDGFERAGQQTVPLAKKVTCDVVPCLCDSVTSSGLSDVVSGDFVGNKRCSEVLELEWDGIDLVMDEGFEAIKLCKEEEV
ncbi:fibroblast growth factor receptor 3-like isoform X2 [Montipora foliosa]|uniref:fibroblast growth factor receptor 3-like isoform X2 n=1 Tax=Montipora foliosa TaxID=591990 RepID=UPI0035F1E30E